jgi:hypothetical protein
VIKDWELEAKRGGAHLHPSTKEAEAGRLQVGGQSGLQREFRVSLHYMIRPCLKKTPKELEL